MSSFTHSSKNIPRNEKDQLQYYYDLKEGLTNDIIECPEKHPLSLLLDNSLISPTQNKSYTIKVIQCGEYYQIYRFNKIKIKNDKIKEKINDKKNSVDLWIDVDTDKLIKFENYQKKPSRGVIVKKNIDRSKFQLQRLIKANENKFKTFITLTFSDNLKSIEEANKKFDIWRTKIKSIYKDFSYVCVPEFQKRGAVHYHLLTDLEIENEYQYIRRNKLTKVKLILPQEGKNSQFDVKYWSYGFTSVFNVKDINIVGYLSKYMTKDIDNRLFGKRRYLCSNNLIKPNEYYINLYDDQEFSIIADILANSDITYDSSYLDVFGDVIDYTEYKRASDRSPE
ncbi:MAG: hypothetical protein ACLTAK_01375 [Bacilli bacterium]